jgi:hypothetical protein
MEQAMVGRETGFANKGLIFLNVILTVSQISSYATGYDGSMMSEQSSNTNPKYMLILNRRLAVFDYMARIFWEPFSQHIGNVRSRLFQDSARH